MSSLGNNLRRLRLKRWCSQEELGKLVNVSRQTISHYENGSSEPSNDMLMHLAASLNVCVDELLGCNGCKRKRKVKEELK